VAGTSLSNGQIPSQLTQAISADPNIKLIIMDGGGNDVLINHRECLSAGASTNAGCQQVVQASIDTANTMMDTAASDGVHDVIYFYYPHIVAGLVGGSAPNELLDYALPRVKAACDATSQRTGGRLACHFIDLVPLFQGHADYIGPDGVHPTATGAQVIGNAIWDVMRANCLGQASGSACCI
jgi:lysophospholipase L1-like esterase